MAFVDFYAAGGAPVGSVIVSQPASPRAWLRAPVRPANKGGWHMLAVLLALAVAFAVSAMLLASYFDDALVGALFAVLLYAAAAPMTGWLGNDHNHRRWTSY